MRLHRWNKKEMLIESFSFGFIILELRILAVVLNVTNTNLLSLVHDIERQLQILFKI